VEYFFEYPQVQTVDIGGQIFDRITMKDVPNCGNTGQPALPARGAQILLPFGTDVSGVEIIPGERISLGSGYNIEPIGKPVKLSSDPGMAEPPVPDAAIYNSDLPYPEARFEKIGINAFRGYRILTLKLQPVQYIPTSGELYYFTDLTVKINMVDSDKQITMFRGLPEDDLEVRTKIDNPEVADSYTAGPVRGGRAYDLLIITTSSLMSSFLPLKDYHDTTGLLTEIHTTTDIGSSSPDDIRDYIRDRYLSDGIQYVIIGADDDIIPAKDLYVQSDYGYDPEIEYNMPADVYFACLDGTYNYDGDSYWGEPNDGEGGGDVDLIAEVYVGRASVGNTTEADRFVDKTIWYLTKQHTNLQNIVLVGEHLGFGGVAEYANFYMDELVDGSSASGYTTIGIPSDQYTIDKLYDYDWPGNDWPQSELVARINNGQHVVNHLGHGSPDYAMKLFNSDIMADLTNSDFCFVYSQTCLAGHLDGLDCWAEYMNIKTDHGAFAVVMNARYGWGTYNSTDGPSQRFNREFWDAVFSPAEGKPELGRANQDSKEDNLYRIGDGCMRWCYYQLNLFGDPSVSVMGVCGLAFSYPNGIPETIKPAQDTTKIEVVVTGIGDGIPVSGSGQLHYKINGGPVQTEAMNEVFPNQYEATLPAVSCDDILEFYFSADEMIGGTIYNPNPTAPFQPIIASSVITILADNFETDQGWTVSGSVSDGAWDRGTPVGGGDRGDPPTDFDGSGQCYLTDNVDDNSDVDDGTTTLISPVIDLSGGDAVIHYARWYSNNFGADPNNDEMHIYISNDNGSGWTLVETVGPVDQASGGWYENSFLVSDFVTPTATIKVRFDASDLGAGSVVEAGIDDFTVISYECTSNKPVIVTATLDDWTAGIPYSVQLMATGGVGQLTWTDKDNDLIGTGLSLSSDGLLSGTPIEAGPITFTAMVTDEAKSSDEKQFNFMINASVLVTTESLADWTVGQAYSAQLEATGGTQPLNWLDRDGDLVGTGLSLAADGSISGTPASDGVINFTARVNDNVGDNDDKALSITINPAVTITTSTLSDGIEDAPYSEQLIASGGTGTKSWTDKNGDLSGTGLALSSDGLLSGTPTDTGTINFIAEVVDITGSSDEKSLSVVIGPDFICGDVNDDTLVNIFDITFLIEYLYRGGPPPATLESADVNNDTLVNIFDVTYLIDFLYKDGPVPECP
jgi:hypothetical protein